MKKPENTLRDYAAKLTDDNLKFLSSRFTQRLSGDLPEALNQLSGSHEIDRYFASAKTCNEFYDLTDQLQSVLEKECDRRYA